MTRSALLFLPSFVVLGILTGPAAIAQDTPFTFSFVEHDMPNVNAATLAWGDYDGDGDLDLYLAGATGQGVEGGLYRNDEGTFVDAGAGLPALAFGGAAWADVDLDGDLDLALAGSTTRLSPYAREFALFRNDGGTFTDIAEGLSGLVGASLAWADYDGDGDLDLVATGSASDAAPHVPSTRLYENQDGRLVESATGVANVMFGVSVWGDVDGSGTPDLLVSGFGEDGPVTRLYRNDAGQFNEIETDLPPITFGGASWGDIDGDGDLDLALSRAQINARDVFEGDTQIFSNDGVQFAPAAESTPLTDVFGGSVNLADYTNDGALDLLALGGQSFRRPYAGRIYQNDGGALDLDILLVGLLRSRNAWGDFDNDGDLDLVSTGLSSRSSMTTNVYRNDRTTLPDDVRPDAPSGLQARVGTAGDGQGVELSWTPPSASVSANLNVSYEVEVRGADGRLVRSVGPAVGFARHAPGTTAPRLALRGLDAGTYTWTVRTLSAAQVASVEAASGTFTVGTATNAETDVPTSLHVFEAAPSPFVDAVRVGVALPEAGALRVAVYSVLGQEVAVLTESVHAAGRHSLTWDGSNAAAGVYFVVADALGQRVVESIVKR